jgi:hypothetical protein
LQEDSLQLGRPHSLLHTAGQSHPAAAITTTIAMTDTDRQAMGVWHRQTDLDTLVARPTLRELFRLRLLALLTSFQPDLGRPSCPPSLQVQHRSLLWVWILVLPWLVVVVDARFCATTICKAAKTECRCVALNYSFIFFFSFLSLFTCTIINVFNISLHFISLRLYSC